MASTTTIRTIPLRLVMPPAVSVPLGTVVFGILYLLFGAGYAPGLGVGFFAGYLAYDMIHYYVHHFRARGPLGRMLRERHMRHHFQDEHARLRDQRALLGRGVQNLLARAHRRARSEQALRRGHARPSILATSGMLEGPIESCARRHL